MLLSGHLGLSISRLFPLLYIFFATSFVCGLELYMLSRISVHDAVPLFTNDGDSHHVLLKIHCYVACEDHALGVISKIAKSLSITQPIQWFVQAVLISQKRWARTAKTLSILVLSANLACVVAITIKAKSFVQLLRGPGPFPAWKEYCSESRAKLSGYYDIRNTSESSAVRPVVIVCAADCALKLFLILFLFVLPTSIKIPIPFEPIVTGSKAQSPVESDVKYPERGPLSEAWKSVRGNYFPRDHPCATALSGQNNACPSWVLSKRLTRMPVVASGSPSFGPHVHHWTKKRYRHLRHFIPILSFAILLDFISLFVYFYTPNSNTNQCTSLCQIRIASICWKPIVLFASLFIVFKQIDLQKYNLWHIRLWHIVVFLWCIVPFSFLGPLIVLGLQGMISVTSISLSAFWGLYIIMSGTLGLILTGGLFVIASYSFKD